MTSFYFKMLPKAIKKGDLNLVRKILNSDVSFKLTHKTCICLAAREKHWDIVEFLIDQGFDVNQEDAVGHTPIFYSVEQNNFEATQLLLRHRADISGKSNLLFTPARKGLGNIVKVLLDYGANVNVKDDCDQTPLHHAILKDSAVYTFLKEGTGTINMSAMEDVVNILLSEGSDVNAKTSNGFSPLHYAIKLKYPRIVSVLLKYGADFHSSVDYDIKSPKLFQFRLKSNKVLALGKLMKPRLTTVLHIAAESDDLASLIMLLSAGATVDSVQYDCTTPLILAIKGQHHFIVKALLEFGADIEQKTKYGLTPLHVACRKGSVSVFNSLLEAGANVNTVCDKGKVPYQYVLQLEAEMNCERLYGDVFENAHHYYRQVYSNSITIKTILQQHLVIMYVNGYYLHDYNKEVAVKTPSNFHKVSKKEIKEFSKNVKICNNVTLYHIVNEIRNPSYVRNPNVLKGLDQAIAVISTKYPGFGNVVKFLVRSGSSRLNLMDQGIECFIHLNKRSSQLPTLPHYVLEVVFSFMHNEDIQTFINCCEVV